jgi:hemin uptake protein HemP
MNPGRRQDDPPSDHDGDPSATGNVRHIQIANNRLDSRDLFVGTRDITILHRSEAYHLRLTAQNKLILTK